MTVAQFNGPVRPRRGRRPKAGHRHRLQVKMPRPIALALTGYAEQMGQPITDLGAYYLIRGWNQTRREHGLETYPMPSYLEDAARQHGSGELQDPLLDLAKESRPAG